MGMELWCIERTDGANGENELHCVTDNTFCEERGSSNGEFQQSAGSKEVPRKPLLASLSRSVRCSSARTRESAD